MNNDYSTLAADAMSMCNKARSKLLPSTLLNCWSKSQRLSMLQVAQTREIVRKLNGESKESTATSILGQDVAEEKYNHTCGLNYRTQVVNPLREIMTPLTSISNASEVAESSN